MDSKIKYEIKPIIRIENENVLQIINNQLCIISNKKDKILCVDIVGEDMLAISAYWIDRLIKIIHLEINKVNTKIDKITKEIIKVWNKIVKPTECISAPNCEYQITILKEEIESKYECKDKLSAELKRLETIKSKLLAINREVNEILRILNVEVEQDFVLV